MPSPQASAIVVAVVGGKGVAVPSTESGTLFKQPLLDVETERFRLVAAILGVELAYWETVDDSVAE